MYFSKDFRISDKKAHKHKILMNNTHVHTQRKKAILMVTLKMPVFSIIYKGNKRKFLG